MRSEVRAYQWGISMQIETLSGHKQQEAKQDPSAAEWEDRRGKERLRETVKEGESLCGGVEGSNIRTVVVLE